MKKLISLLLTAMLLCTALPVFAEEAHAHVLVVYFSHAGENYNVGVIEEGNTAKMGKIIAEQMNADIFELVPVVPYSNVYDEVLDQATEEQRTNARPEYEGEIENWDQYDTVFIGFPIWWGEIPNIVYTFMDSYDFTGKTVIPFNTHEGSGQAHSQRDISDYLPAATVLKGLAIRGSKAQNDAEETAKNVSNWLNGLNLNK
ncbi:MAG: NAD(P)H-dependent oxidoreductase [Clostridia bacterium]|nr:NAD(P)H-dependent oxidoreductase [Clostridia bacterium]